MGHRKHFNIHEKFWSHVNIDHDGCWEWVGPNSVQGYGSFYVSSCGSRGNRTIYQPRAHRLSLMWAVGSPPEGKPLACHRCNNRACVRPDHLYWGDKSDNANDAVAAGVWSKHDRRGEKGSNSKLANEDVRAIRHLRDLGISAYAIADFFGIGSSQVYRIEKRTSWGHVA